MKKFIIPIAVIVVLIVPSVLYILFTRGEHNILNLPYYGPKSVVQTTDAKGRPKTDTVYHAIPAFSFINQDGKAYGTADLDSHIYVAYFMNTTNADTSKQLNTLMQEVQKRIKGDYRIKAEEFRIIAFTVKPEEDSVPVLKTMSTRLQADNAMWNFVTGPRADIYTLAQKGYLHKENEDLSTATLVTGKAVLVDKQRHIRGIYNATNLADVNKLIDGIKGLFANYRLAKKVNNNEAPKLEQRREKK
ncbi:MAG: SCO family protein [Sphingobacteriales bacterium JAD_PAG50586_3]|nr:MAG: SCO family protein [Sphingobacteriales bacterium JAD_PAG50586_3]